MAAHQYNDDGFVIEDAQIVQQHTVFVEMIREVEQRNDTDQIHEFGAVAGYAEECEKQQNREVFDNAVLWFNDQFLFGNKTNEDIDIRVCVIPQLWAMGIGSSQIHRTLNETTDADTGNDGIADDTVDIDLVKNLIELDNDCFGCIFEYEATFYTTDPNGYSWMVDKLVYPSSFSGDLFASGSGEDCYDGSGTLMLDDQRSPGVHADECEDRHDTKPGTDPGEDNHRYHDDDQGDSDSSLMEPLYVTHLQVDPAEGNFDGGSAPVGAALGDETLAQYSDHYISENNQGNYTFLLAVDFLAFENQALNSGNYTSWDDPENETHEEATYSDGDTLAGDAHGEQDDYGPDHAHSTVNLDIFLHNQAPYFVETNNVWAEDPDNAGQTPEVNDRCDDTADPNDARSPHIQNRAVMVCDTTADRAFHAHDGTQTTFPIN